MESSNQENQAAQAPQTETQVSRPREKTVLLHDGRKARVTMGKGRSARNAMRTSKGDPQEANMVMAANSTIINGNALLYEDFLDLDLDDFYAILTAFNELTGKSESQETST